MSLMPLPADDFASAQRAHKASDLPLAERLCRRLVQEKPTHFDAWLLLADCCRGQGKGADSEQAARQAVRLLPQSAEARFRLGAALAVLGRRDEASASYREALTRDPGHAEALTNLGVLLAESGRLADALPLLAESARRGPSSPVAQHNLGVALAQHGQPDQAADRLREALRLDPTYPDACYNLANVLASQGKRGDAIELYRKAIALRPTYGDAYNNLGLALIDENRPGEALILLEHALRLRPTPEQHANRGLALEALARYAEAADAQREALRLNPAYADAHSNLGNALRAQGRLEEALACYDLALAYQPDTVSIRWNRALCLLQAGDFQRGWQDYEWRWKRPQTPPRPLPGTAWNGEPIEGKTIFLYCEQGLGDAIQFVRYTASAAERGVRVILECPGRLAELFDTCPGVDRVQPEGQPLSAYDFHAPLLSLPRLCGTNSLADIPARVPYLTPRSDLVAKWRERLAALDGYRVGVVWQGNVHHKGDRHRSLPLAAFAPVTHMPGVRLVSLQHGPGTEQIAALRARFPVAELGPDFDAGGFSEVAAVMHCLDLVISVDTAAGHLAGALGVPVWLLLGAAPDWRWLTNRDDTPWYASMRLFRQNHPGDWDDVMLGVANALRESPRKPAPGS
jgi:tetratricopeptide (TPR) repeat protein